MSESESNRCLDCGAPAPESFCSRCGQSTRERRAPFWTIVRELSDHLSLDTKLPRSLYLLLLAPGRLTELYLEGKRASYVLPLRMYLVVSLIFFFVFTIEPPNVSEVDVYVGGELVGGAKSEAEAGAVKWSLSLMNAEDETTWLGAQIEKRLLAGKRQRFLEMDPQELVDRVFRGLQRHVKLALFVFLPLLALALRLLFLRSRYLYFDHLIFALHFQSFLFLSLVLVSFFGSPWLYGLTILAIFPAYLALALRRVYAQRWRWLAPEVFALGLAYLVLLALVLWGVMLLVMRGI